MLFESLFGIGLVISDMKIAVVLDVLHKVVTHEEDGDETC